MILYGDVSENGEIEILTAVESVNEEKESDSFSLVDNIKIRKGLKVDG